MASVILALLYIVCLSSTLNCLANEFPLRGSKQRLPGQAYAYMRDKSLVRLLDVGACLSDDDMIISRVPLLDGTSSDSKNTLCQDHYAMKIVLFDLQLIELKALDPVYGTFTVKLSLVLHWMDSIINGSDGTPAVDDCTFLCDSMSPTHECCDSVWVPPFLLHPRCKINEIQHSTPSPPTYYGGVSFDDCISTAEKCYWRRIWYVNMDATCGASNMNFRNFPFDVQELPIDFLNPYASRTWFQITKGFLKQNVGEGINGIDLNPDRKIPGWYIEDVRVSSTCDASQAWKQTFLLQDKLLTLLDTTYSSQQDDIVEALTLKTLSCAKNMQNIDTDQSDGKNFGPTNKKLYDIALASFEGRVISTLEKYRDCMAYFGKDFHWNKSIHIGDELMLPEVGSFNTSPTNVNRSFNILDLKMDQQTTKVWFPCIIAAVANLTTPGVRVNIIVKRYKMFYMVKLILPTIACVAFTFSAFGLQPTELIGRLTVVVPSAIALATLQSIVVTSDVSPVAYITPTTYIILFSYLAQLSIAFESILVYWLHNRRTRNNFSFKRRTLSRSKASLHKRGALEMAGISNQPYEEKGAMSDESYEQKGGVSDESYEQKGGVSDEIKEVELSIQGSSKASFPKKESSEDLKKGATSTKSPENQFTRGEKSSRKSKNLGRTKNKRTRLLDLKLMVGLILVYFLMVLLCIFLPWHNSFKILKYNDPSVISIWN